MVLILLLFIAMGVIAIVVIITSAMDLTVTTTATMFRTIMWYHDGLTVVLLWVSLMWHTAVLNISRCRFAHDFCSDGGFVNVPRSCNFSRQYSKADPAVL